MNGVIMKQVNRILTAVDVVLAVCVLAAPAQANGCKVAVRRNVVVVQKHVAAVTPVVAAVAAVPVYNQYSNAIYGAAYQPDGLLEAFKLVFGQNQQLIQQNPAAYQSYL